MIVSIVGNVGAGKSTIISDLLEIYSAREEAAYLAAIDEFRKAVWNERNRCPWTWEEEDEAYSRLFSTVVQKDKEGAVVFIETTGLSVRMRHAHRRLAQISAFEIIKISCPPEICVERYRNRDRDMSESPVLPFASDLEEGIFEVEEDLYDLAANFEVSSGSLDSKSCAQKIAGWLDEADHSPVRPAEASLSLQGQKYLDSLRNKYRKDGRALDVCEQSLRQAILEHDAERMEIARIIAARVASESAHEVYPHEKPVALLFGGFVRDAILGVPSLDADMQVFGLEPARLKEILNDCFPGCANLEGNRYPIIRIKTHLGAEVKVSIQQSDPLAPAKNFPDILPTITPEQAAQFSDFTINSLYADPLTGDVFDFCGGLDDLKKASLRMLDPQNFKGQPSCFLRPYRACSLVGRFGLSIESDTLAFLQKRVAEGILHKASPHFAAEELKKAFARGRSPALALGAMLELGVLASDFPELIELIADEEAGNSSCWTQTMKAIERASALLRGNEERLSSHRRMLVQLTVLFKDLFFHYSQQMEEPQVIESLQEALSILLLETRSTASIISALLTKEPFDTLCSDYDGRVNENSSAGSSAAKSSIGRKPGGMMPFAAKREIVQDPCKKGIYRFLDGLWPCPLDEFLVFAHVCDPEKSHQPRYDRIDMVQKLIQQYKVDLTRPGPLIDRAFLVSTLKVEGGLHIGRVIGDVEKRRLKLIGRKSARSYLKRNLHRVYARVGYDPGASQGPPSSSETDHS